MSRQLANYFIYTFFFVRFSFKNRIPKRGTCSALLIQMMDTFEFRERNFFLHRSSGECQEFFGGRVKIPEKNTFHTVESPTENNLMTISLAAMEWNFEFVKWNFLFSIYPLSQRREEKCEKLQRENYKPTKQHLKKLALWCRKCQYCHSCGRGRGSELLRSLITEACEKVII